MNSKQISDELYITRNFTLPDLVTNDDEGKIEGHAAVFNKRTNIAGMFEEVIEPGAFDGCDFDDVLLFVNHNQNKIPLARSRRNNGNSTMQISIDEKGLFIRANLDIENNQESKSLYSAVKRNDIDGMSFAFRIKDQKWEGLDTEIPLRRILKVAKVYEVSAVNMPAYADTDISARDKVALDNAKRTLDNVRTIELDNSKNAVEIEHLRNQILMKG